jgi:hypothetical protein
LYQSRQSCSIRLEAIASDQSRIEHPLIPSNFERQQYFSLFLRIGETSSKSYRAITIDKKMRQLPENEKFMKHSG